MRLIIADDFDPGKIARSGQCFRTGQLEDGTWRFQAGQRALYLKEEGEGAFALSCGEDEWKAFWAPYFDMGRDYAALRRTARGKNAWIDRTMDFGAGLRLLRQDPWETLVTFILSQRKSIPAIAGCVEKLCRRYGEEIRTKRETLHAFPSPQALAGADLEGLAACGLGYRAPYVKDAALRAAAGVLDLCAACTLPDEALTEKLKEVKGVGDKVAACAALFAFGRTGCVPVDVWIGKALREKLGGMDAFRQYEENAGIVQQYVFYYMKHGEG